MKLKGAWLVAALAVLVVSATSATPALAAKKPRIVSAQMIDADGDLRADGVRVGWSTAVTHRRDADGSYPLSVSGYDLVSLPKVKRQREMRVPLTEKTAADGDAHPSISYVRTRSKPIASKRGTQARRQKFTGTRAFGGTGSAPPPSDTVAPETTIDSGPAGLTADTTPSFTFSSSETGSAFECRVDSATFGACSGPGATHTLLPVTVEGSYRFEVRAIDAAGNVDATPASRDFVVDVDADGFGPPDDCGPNDATIFPGAADPPDDAGLDSDCDGIDGDVDTAVFVAPGGGNAAGCGTLASPCGSIQVGISRAASLGKPDVLVRQGVYSGTVTLSAGVSLYGGYAPGFGSRATGPSANATTIAGTANVPVRGTSQSVGMIADGVSSTTVADLTVQAPSASGTTSGSGRSSYGVIAADSTLSLRGVKVIAAAGAAGSPGGTGVSASQTAAPAGATGGDADEFVTACDDSSHGSGGGGSQAPGLSQTRGGDGGDGGEMDTTCKETLGVIYCDPCDATAGDPGGNAAVTVSVSGTGGPGGGTCASPTSGFDGRVVHGAAGSGGVAGGHLEQDFWYANRGGTGGLGADGGGGGGGGGSGGCDSGTDSYGAGGGGGGAGGVRAPSAGSGGGGGGGSFGVYLIDSALSISGSEIDRGNAASGSAGGDGGLGQPGGAGGPGGDGTFNGDSKPGGEGGDGGRGGSSGGGGGGAGGISFAIYRSSGSSAVTTSQTTVIGGGAGGSGTGGTVLVGNGGLAGGAGTLGNTGVCAAASQC